MTFKEELDAAVKKIFRDSWDSRDGRVVPVPEDLGLGNDAVKLNATVLYADIADSTKLVDTSTPQFAAEVYRSYLTCAATIVKANGGVITAYDGDRIMAVFIGDLKNSNAAKTGLQINSAVIDVINPALAGQYPQSAFQLRQVIGIDTSPLFVARIGVRNDNDLVWVGRAANYAAKLAAINEYNTVFITTDVFNKLAEFAKIGSPSKKLMWTPRRWTQMGNLAIHSSNWKWNL
jgi:class 3 adenylate cyclase